MAYIPVHRYREKLGQKIEQIDQKIGQIDKVPEVIAASIDKKFKEERELRERESKEREDRERIEKERADKERLEKEKDTQKANKALEDARQRGILEDKNKLLEEMGKDVLCPTCVDMKRVGAEKSKLVDKELNEIKQIHEKFHKLERIDGNNSGLIVKCTGPDCGKEYGLVDLDADHKCTTCGYPLKKPEDKSKDIEDCPLCGGKKATKYNWSFRNMKKRRDESLKEGLKEKKK